MSSSLDMLVNGGQLEHADYANHWSKEEQDSQNSTNKTLTYV